MPQLLLPFLSAEAHWLLLLYRRNVGHFMNHKEGCVMGVHLWVPSLAMGHWPTGSMVQLPLSNDKLVLGKDNILPEELSRIHSALLLRLYKKYGEPKM